MAHPDSILRRLDAAPRRRWSQNFLMSSHWADWLTKHVVAGGPVDEIWEIGPGLGALTRDLVAKSPCPVRLFEIDPKLSAYLRGELPAVPLEEGDFLFRQLTPLLPPGRRISVLSNLPYHLSSPILFRLIEISAHLDRAVLTFQREFAQRLCAAPRTKDYAALSVLAQAAFRIESLGTLPPGAFHPPPKVHSEALLLEPKVVEDWTMLSRVVHAAFQQRRKKMISNLRQAFPEAPLDVIFLDLGIDSMARAETLALAQFRALTARLSPFVKHPTAGVVVPDGSV